MVSEEGRANYRQAYADWQQQLAAMHDVLLDGSRVDPVKLKALLNRESRAKTRYDQARLQLLGIDAEIGIGQDNGEAEPD